jgi:hypothetical protein
MQNFLELGPQKCIIEVRPPITFNMFNTNLKYNFTPFLFLFLFYFRVYVFLHYHNKNIFVF